MGDVVGQCVDIVLRRVRDPLGTAHPRADVRALLTDAQRCVNLAVPGTLAAATLPTQPERVLYDFADLTDATTGDPVPPTVVARVERITRPDGVELIPVPWRSFGRCDPHWLRRIGGPFQLWARLGRDLVICHPAQKDPGTLTLTYVPLLPALASDDDTLALREDRTPAVLALTEALLLAQRRHWAPMRTALATLRTELARLPRTAGVGQAAWS